MPLWGNERLTAVTGAVLLVLFAAECLTLLDIGNLLTLHVFLGMLLLGPVGLKTGSTLWRFARYYTGSAAYVRKGPPARLQRVTGPFVIVIHLASHVPELPGCCRVGRITPATCWQPGPRAGCCCAVP